MHNFLAGGAAAFSIGMAAVSGFGTAVKFTKLPAIEGTASRVSPVRAGDVVTLEWTILKRTDCPGSFSRAWSGEDGFRMVEPARGSALPRTIEAKVYRIPTEIPHMAPAGNLELFINGVYDCPSGAEHYSLGPVNLIVEG